MTRAPAAPLAFTLALGAAALSAGCRDQERGVPEPLESIPPLPDRTAERADEKPGFIAALTPKESGDVAAPYTSASATILVKLGDVVTKGQVLARLDDRVLRQELDAAKAQLKTSRASINQAVVDKKGAEVVLAREKSAEAAGVGSKAEVAAARQAVEKATASISYAIATAEERTTRIAQLQDHLREMTLVSPIAGSVAAIYAQNGARVEEGHTVIRVISGGVYVKFAIPADKAGTVKPGDAVDLRLDRRTELLTATVDQVSPELDAVAQMVIARAELVNAPADLQPGTVGRILPKIAHAAPPRP
ncbi:MAG TPA: efflux RND transporter periplasmic adaptor subunit [Kofleriaceae bacterium]